MKPTLQALRRTRRPSARAVERYLAAHEFPVVDETGVTFVWRGNADSVRLVAFVNQWPGPNDFERVGATDLWALRVDLPPGSRIEYKFDIAGGGSAGWINDPLNPHEAGDPFGANSVCRAYGYREPAWIRPHPDMQRGQFDVLKVPIPGADVMGQVRVWLPPRYRRTRRYPLLVVHDGGDFFRFAGLDTAMDRLAHDLEIPEMVVALHEPTNRNHEYVANDTHARTLTEAWLPALRQRYPLDGRHGLLGASLGGVASLHTAWRAPPGTWTQLALLSGSFVFSDIGPHGRAVLFDPIVRFVNAFRVAPAPLDASWYVACGRYESLIDMNRALVSLLSGRRADVRYDEVPDGHHWQCWRDRLRDALGWLFPGPLWMVYD